MFALNLPALQSCKSGLPTWLIWGFFPGGGRGQEAGTTVWQDVLNRSSELESMKAL